MSTAATKKPKAPVRIVLATCYCPVCRGHWTAQVSERHVREEVAKGHGFPFLTHPVCLAGKGGAG